MLFANIDCLYNISGLNKMTAWTSLLSSPTERKMNEQMKNLRVAEQAIHSETSK